MASKKNGVALGLCALAFWLLARQALAQQPVVVTTPDGAAAGVMVEKVEGGAKVVRTPAGMRGGPPGAEMPKPGEPPKPGAEKGKPGAEKGKPDEKKTPAIQRPTTPPKPPDPNELKVKPDKEGKLTFNFKNQPWQGVLECLADVSGMSLDWQELPGDYLNLTTPPGRRYTIRETRDLVNRHLLARGYTLLSQGSILSVVSVSKLNPAMVPRVDPAQIEELAKQEPHAFVKVSLALDWMTADDAVKELEPMRSPNGKLTALKGTNRLEAMDTAMNLRDILQVLAAEQSKQTQEGLVRTFPLKYAKASDVHEQLRELLGMEGKPGRAKTPAGSPAQMADAARMAMMRGGGPMMMEGQPGGPQPGQPGQPGGPGGLPKPKTEVNLAINQRENSIIAVAPPDKMMIIAQAIKALDVPGREGESILGTMQRWSVYRLASIEPEPIIETLQDLGNLDPRTRLQADKKNHAILAYAPLADHVTIRSLVERLDGSARKFYVIPLKRLEAEYVAGTIEFMMTGERGDKKKEQRSRYSYFYGGFDSGSSSSQKEESTDKFHVEPDIERNRIILKANSIEFQEVQDLLEKLGENTGAGGSSTIRVLELPQGKETDELLERIRRQWPSVSPNTLVLPPPEQPKEKPGLAPPKTEPPKTESPQPAAPGRRTAAREEPSAAEPGVTEGSTTLAVALAPEPSPPAAAAQPGKAAKEAPAQEPPPPPLIDPPPKIGPPADPPPPVTITRTPDGKLMITSLDTRALDRLEDLITQLSPTTRPDYQIFKLKYAVASSVATVLKEIFKEGGNQRIPLWMQFEYGVGDSSDKNQGRLSKRRPLKIVSEYDTNSILVQGADATQLKTIRELVEFYDKPEPPDAQSVHQTEKFILQWTKAETVAETIKDLYRDLLSPKDKALANQQQDQQRRPFVISFYGEDSSGEGEMQKRPRFQGLLSIGVDKVSNTLIVSSPPYLMKEVSKLIKELDQAAKPSDAVSVVKLGAGVNAQKLEEAISKLVGDGSKTAAGRPKPETPQPGQPGDRRRGRDGSGRDRRGG